MNKKQNLVPKIAALCALLCVESSMVSKEYAQSTLAQANFKETRFEQSIQNVAQNARNNRWDRDQVEAAAQTITTLLPDMVGPRQLNELVSRIEAHMAVLAAQEHQAVAFSQAATGISPKTLIAEEEDEQGELMTCPADIQELCEQHCTLDCNSVDLKLVCTDIKAKVVCPVQCNVFCDGSMIPALKKPFEKPDISAQPMDQAIPKVSDGLVGYIQCPDNPNAMQTCTQMCSVDCSGPQPIMSCPPESGSCNAHCRPVCITQSQFITYKMQTYRENVGKYQQDQMKIRLAQSAQHNYNLRMLSLARLNTMNALRNTAITTLIPAMLRPR